MRSFVLGVATLGLLTMPAQAQEVLDSDALAQLSAPLREFKPKDQFDAPPNVPSVADKRFVVTVKPLARREGCDGFAGWEYDGQKQEFSAYPGHDTLNGRLKYGPSIELPKRKEWQATAVHYTGISCQRLSPGSYRAANAYGAEIEVSVVQTKVTGIGFATLELYDYLNAWDRDPFYTDKAAGNDARKLAEGMQIRLSGTLGAWPDGRTMICANYGGGAPTRDYPVDRAQETCLFNGQIEKFEYLDANGAVLGVVNAKSQKTRK